jgi:hypothetical protein
LTFATLLIPIYLLEDGLLRLCICLILGSSSFLFFVWNFGFKLDEREMIQKIIKTQILNKIRPEITSIK